MLALFAALSLDPLFAAPTLRGAHVGALVVNADTGAVVYARDADDAFIPASTMKLIVGSSALDELGNAFAFTTTLATDGPNLYLRGDGDPTLRDADLDDAAATLKELAQTAFAGAFAGDATHAATTRYPDGWQVDDLPNDYAAPASALSFNDNAFHIVVHPGASVGAAASLSITPRSATLHVENEATTGSPKSPDTTDLSVDWSQPDTVRVIGSVPIDERDGAALDAAVLDPAAATLDLFAQHLTRAGITLGPQQFSPTPPAARTLWVHRSAPLPQLLAAMWQPSDNLIAETLLDELGSAAPGDARANGIAREIAWLRRIDVEPETLTIADGSGMSAYDRVTPRALVTILRHDWNGGNRAVVLAALPQPGKPGTLERAFTASTLAGRLFAKTGTSNHTRTLAGFLETPHGTFAFALLVNDWIDPDGDAAARLRSFQQRFLESIQ